LNIKKKNCTPNRALTKKTKDTNTVPNAHYFRFPFSPPRQGKLRTTVLTTSKVHKEDTLETSSTTPVASITLASAFGWGRGLRSSFCSPIITDRLLSLRILMIWYQNEESREKKQYIYPSQFSTQLIYNIHSN